jgi:hypothetical protein
MKKSVAACGAYAGLKGLPESGLAMSAALILAAILGSACASSSGDAASAGIEREERTIRTGSMIARKDPGSVSVKSVDKDAYQDAIRNNPPANMGGPK